MNNVLAMVLTDIDECLIGTNKCEQNCTNTVGGYTCSCSGGYKLSSDGLHCSGTCLGTNIFKQ